MEEERCKHCGHLMSKHPRPKHLVGFGEWDYYDHRCCVKNCQCRMSCFGQLLLDDGTVIKKCVKSEEVENGK